MRNQTVKIYGLTAEQIKEVLAGLNLDKSEIRTYVREKYQDAFLFVEERKENDSFLTNLSKIANAFAANIYADTDVSLYERLYELLKLRRKSICLMEQATGGIITSNLMAFDGAEEIVKASYVLPSNKLMIDHFDLNPFKFTANNGVCSEIAFDIASHIRSRIPADLYVVCISTLADGNNLYYNRDAVISYVAVGTESGVKLFKLESTGDKRDIMNQVSKNICFKLINILK